MDHVSVALQLANLDRQIELKRIELNRAGNLGDPKLLEHSQELDELIVQRMKLQYQNKKPTA